MKITRETLEKQQIWIYGVTLVIGGIVGIAGKDSGLRWGWTISPFIAVLMYAHISKFAVFLMSLWLFSLADTSSPPIIPSFLPELKNTKGL